MQTLILCGGKGTRAYPHTETLPKPLLEVGGIPVLRHVMDIYAAQGFEEFVLATGYRGDQIADYVRTSTPAEWSVRVIDTGEDTNTGGRVQRCAEAIDGTFFVTYADGLGDVDLPGLRQFHAEASGLGTMTTVPLASQYGTVSIGGDGRVQEFKEKPRLGDHWINAGYFVFEPAVFEQWPGEDLERDVLPALADRGVLFARRHDGFWRSMDTYKDSVELSALCSEGYRPWMR